MKEKLLPARLAMWTRSGEIFGLPLDVHPVSLTYRKDLFDTAGVDPTAAKTWSEFQLACGLFEHYWRAHGRPERHAIELPSAAADYLVVMLQQRHINLLDADNHACLADDRVAATVAFYARLVAGPDAVAGEPSPGETMWAGDLSRGDIAMVFTPDWRAAQIPELAPDLAGKLAMMPLPLFDDSDAPTGSWGGTMLGIPRNCPDPERAWHLAEFIATHPPSGRAALIPPLPQLWADPRYHQPDPFYVGSQSTSDLYIKLARQLPPRYVTSFTAIAAVELSHVLGNAVSQLRSGFRSGDTQNLERNCRAWLDDASADLQRRIAFGTFDR